MMKNSIKLIAGIILVLAQLSAHATEGNLFTVVSTGAPAMVDISLCLNGKAKLSCETEKVTALDLLISTTVPNRMYPDAGIFINTPGYTIASLGIACTMYDPSGYCIFGVSSGAPASISLVNSTIKTARFAYVGNFDSFHVVSQCPIIAGGALDACTSLMGPDINNTNLFNGASDIAFNAAGTLAYITNYNSGTVVKCDVSAGGTFSLCSVQVNFPVEFPTHYPYVQSISLNSAGTHAYIGVYDDVYVYVCNVAPGTGNLTGCGLATGAFDYPTNVLFDSTGNYAYVGQWAGTTLQLCEVTAGTGDLTMCSATPSTANLGEPSGIAFNPAKTIIYVANYSYNLSAMPPVAPVSKCTVNSDHTLSCVNTGDNYSNLPSPAGIAINSAGTLAYISNYTNSSSALDVAVCQINATNGHLQNCMPSGAGPVSDYLFGISLLY